MFIKRQFQNEIFKAFSTDFITLLIGPRRVGKTYLVVQYLSELKCKIPAVVLNLDEMDLRHEINAGHLEKILENKTGLRLAALPNLLTVVVDEAQKSPAVFDQIKILYDRFKDQKKIKFILTGSGSLSLHEKAAESLAGRVFIYQLGPFTLAEAIRTRHTGLELPCPFSDLVLQKDQQDPLEDKILAIEPTKHLVRDTMREQLIWGGFPEVLLLPDNEQRKVYLANYRQTYLEKDVRALDQVGDINSFNSLLEIAASQIGMPRRNKKIYDALGISPQTMEKYLGILQATFLYDEIRPYIHSPLRRLTKAPKGYLCDNGLVSYLRGLYSLDDLIKTGAVGHWFENWVFCNLRMIFGQQTGLSSYFYWRTNTGLEVGFIIKHESRVIPVEVKFSEKVSPSDVRGLSTFLAEEQIAPYGIVIYNGEYRFDPKQRIHYFPAWAML